MIPLPKAGLILVAVAASLGAADATAQSTAWPVKSTDTLRIWAPQHTLNGVEAKLQRQSADSTFFLIRNPSADAWSANAIATSAITRVDVREGTVRSGKRAFTGAAIGLVIGAVVFGGLESGTSHSSSQCSSNCGFSNLDTDINVGVARAVGGVIGAVVGAVVGNMPVTRWRRVYP